MKIKCREKERKPQSVMVCFKSQSVKYSIVGQLTFDNFLFNLDLYSYRVGICRKFRGYDIYNVQKIT